jgi:hypothetical protein
MELPEPKCPRDGDRESAIHEPEKGSQKLLRFAYDVGKNNRAGLSAAQFVRRRLDDLQIGQELTSIPWGSKKPIPLPPYSL